MTEKTADFDIKLHSFTTDGKCKADVTIKASGTTIIDVLLHYNTTGGVQANMPSVMGPVWQCDEVEWSLVQDAVIKAYRKHRLKVIGDTNWVNGICATVKNLTFRFYSRRERVICNIERPDSTSVRNVHIIAKRDSLSISWPQKYENSVLYYHESDMLKNLITQEFVLPADGEEATVKQDGYKLSFLKDVSYTVSISVGKTAPICYLVYEKTGSYPPDMKLIKNSKWDNSLCTKKELAEYLAQANRIVDRVLGFISPSEKTLISKATQKAKERNEYGRIKNAERSSIAFYSRSILRPIQSRQSEKRKSVNELVIELTKGIQGGIGPFEIGIASWVNKLRYTSSTMILDLIHAGYLDIGHRQNVNEKKLNESLDRMWKHQLVELTHFYVGNEYGNIEGESRSAQRVIILDNLGFKMLRELGKNHSTYNAFDICRDGNDIKRYLAANQWLVYWLNTFPELIGDSYRTSCTVLRKGADFNGARLYATVTCNGCSMVGEPLRRTEPEEVESNKVWLVEKLHRFIDMFSNADELYEKTEKFNLAGRPVLVYICEDDEHIKEVWDVIKDVVLAHPEQEIWFTTDLRVYNYNMVGQRFLSMNTNEPVVINTKERLGIEDTVKDTEASEELMVELMTSSDSEDYE